MLIREYFRSFRELTLLTRAAHSALAVRACQHAVLRARLDLERAIAASEQARADIRLFEAAIAIPIPLTLLKVPDGP